MYLSKANHVIVVQSRHTNEILKVIPIGFNTLTEREHTALSERASAVGAYISTHVVEDYTLSFGELMAEPLTH